MEKACFELYARYTASYLRTLTHIPGSPWDDAYTPNVAHIIISVDSIKKYFLEQDDIVLSERKFTEDDFVGYRDKDGILVLPKEWDDEEV